jgi:hypothetical protein
MKKLMLMFQQDIAERDHEFKVYSQDGCYIGWAPALQSTDMAVANTVVLQPNDNYMYYINHDIVAEHGVKWAISNESEHRGATMLPAVVHGDDEDAIAKWIETEVDQWEFD